MGKDSWTERFKWYDFQVTVKLNPLNWNIGFINYPFKCLDIDFGPIGVIIYYGNI